MFGGDEVADTLEDVLEVFRGYFAVFCVHVEYLEEGAALGWL